jgi:hypothetical protein
MRRRVLVSLFRFVFLAEFGVIAYLVKSKAVAQQPQGMSLGVVPQRTKLSTNPIVPPASRFDWSTEESADYKTYLANLRAIGCPEETVRDIIIAAVDKLLASRSRAIAAKRIAE